MRFGLLTLALSLVAAPLAAQDLTGEYLAAARVFSLPGTPNDPDAQLAAAADLVGALQGPWAPAWLVLDDISTPSGLEALAAIADSRQLWCERQTQVARQTGPRSFEMAVFSRGEDTGHAVRYQYVLGRSFQRSVDEIAFLNRLGLMDPDIDTPPSVYVGSGVAGVVEVFRPSANILVIQPQGTTAEIYLRCP